MQQEHRRLAAILAADVFEYSRLMAAEDDYDTRLMIGMYEENDKKICYFTASMPSQTGDESSLDRAGAIVRNIYAKPEVLEEELKKGAATVLMEAIFFAAYKQMTPTSQEAVVYIKEKSSQIIQECLSRLARREKFEQVDIVGCGVVDEKMFAVVAQAEGAVLGVVLPVA